MDNKRDYIEKIIAENYENEIDAAIVEERLGVETPDKDLPNLKKDIIDFELINRTNEEQTINLFELPTGINPSQNLNYGDLFFTKYSETIITLASTITNQDWQIDWIDGNGVPQSATTAVITLGITELITQLNLVTGDSFGYEIIGANVSIYKIPIDTWVYWNPPPPGSQQPANTLAQSFYTENEFTTLIANPSTPTIYNFTTYEVQGGTGISIEDISGNLTYTELAQELKNNVTPYIFNTLTVYANNISQANIPITKVLRGQAGNTSKLIDNPTVLYQKQFVVTEEISLPSKTLNSLKYKLLPLETVRIIITYSFGNLNAITDVINEYIQDGIPFNVALSQLPVEISKKEKEYIEDTLKKIWHRRKRELKMDGIDINVDNIFDSEPSAKSKILMGSNMKLVNDFIKSKNTTSEKNIKNLVSNYVAKGDAQNIQDPYSYMNDL